MKHRAIRIAFIGVFLLGGAVYHDSVRAQEAVECAVEVRQLRWLVQKYGSERTTLEFALATSEARRQAAEARLKALEEALQSAPKGQK